MSKSTLKSRIDKIESQLVGSNRTMEEKRVMAGPVIDLPKSRFVEVHNTMRELVGHDIELDYFIKEFKESLKRPVLPEINSSFEKIEAEIEYFLEQFQLEGFSSYICHDEDEKSTDWLKGLLKFLSINKTQWTKIFVNVKQFGINLNAGAGKVSFALERSNGLQVQQKLKEMFFHADHVQSYHISLDENELGL